MRDSHITEMGLPKRSIAAKMRIDLIGLAEAPDLHASFD